jgi:hypothetical protein
VLIVAVVECRGICIPRSTAEHWERGVISVIELWLLFAFGNDIAILYEVSFYTLSRETLVLW